MAKRSKKKKHLLRKIIITLLVMVILFIVLCFLTPSEAAEDTASGTIQHLELPAPVAGEQIIEHMGYTLSYNEENEVASWVAYELTRNEVLGTSERADDFREDPMVITGSATLSDYRSSGYDRGHLAPAADFKWSDDAMSDTFYMSNMTPQEPSFNRGIWADLEAVVRNMAYDEGTIYVVTGPVLTDGPYKTIGENKVSVPKNFYKVVLKYDGDNSKAIGFVLENENSDRDIESFALSVDEVEKITGIDFFPLLEDTIEENVERKEDTSDWTFRIYLPSSDEGNSSERLYVSDTGNPLEDVWYTLLTMFNEIKLSLIKETGTEPIFRMLGLI